MDDNIDTEYQSYIKSWNYATGMQKYQDVKRMNEISHYEESLNDHDRKYLFYLLVSRLEEQEGLNWIKGFIEAK